MTRADCIPDSPPAFTALRCNTDAARPPASGTPHLRTAFWKLSPLTRALWSISSVLSIWINFAILRLQFDTSAAAALIFIVLVHELGHYAMGLRLGIEVLPPIFVPKIGAFVVVTKFPLKPALNAKIGLAGPVAGTFASLLVHLLAIRLRSDDLLYIAHLGYLLHLVNLIPAGTLDGGRVAALVGRRLWIPGALLFGYVIVRYWDGSVLDTVVSVLMLVPALWMGLMALFERGKKGRGPDPASVRYRRQLTAAVYATTVLACIGGYLTTRGTFQD